MTDIAATPFAVVTGASSGLGRELAKQFAGHGFDLLIAAEDVEVHEAAELLRAAGGAVEAVQVDLATVHGVDELYGRITAAGRDVEALALNAGVAAGGAFVGPGPDRTSLADELEIVDLNVRSTMHLAKYVVGDMVARNHGRVLFTSSIAATTPGAFQAVYNASKSFVQSFALALRSELQDTGVTVTALIPGPTETRLFERADMHSTPMGESAKDDPAAVAREGFEAMMAGRERVVSASLTTRAMGHGSRFVPDRVKAEFNRRMAEPGSATRDA